MKTLVFFGATKMEDMLEKGNVWYVRHYEVYFDRVYVTYLSGKSQKEVKNGRTTLVSLAHNGSKLDLLLSPWRLLKFAREVKATSYITADLVFSWWTSVLLRFVLKAKIVLMPVCMPEQIYQSSGRSLSGWPIWFEKVFLRFSFMSADRVITGENITVYINWLSSLKYAKHKLKIVDILVDELPNSSFYEAMGRINRTVNNDEHTLLYVGRLHHEKMVGDLIKAVAIIHKKGIKVRLKIIVDGPEKSILEKIAVEMGVQYQIDFLGTKMNDELVYFYKNADVFVSPLTGTSIREAALCKLPVVAYNIDWVKGVLINGVNALLVERGDIEGLAQQIIRLLDDRSLGQRLAESFYQYAREKWSVVRLNTALEKIFQN